MNRCNNTVDTVLRTVGICARLCHINILFRLPRFISENFLLTAVIKGYTVYSLTVPIKGVCCAKRGIAHSRMNISVPARIFILLAYRKLKLRKIFRHAALRFLRRLLFFSGFKGYIEVLRIAGARNYGLAVVRPSAGA